MTQIIDLVKRNARLVALIAVVVILVVVTFIFYSGSQSSADEQAKLETQVASAKVNLNLAQDQYDLPKLQAEQARLTGSSSFLSSFPSVGLSAYIAGAADKYGVELVSLTPKGAVGAETIGGQKYARYDTGVEVSGVMEEAQAKSNSGTEFNRLRVAGADVRLDGNPRNMHHKVLIIDDQIVMFGSYNFSFFAETTNDENLIILHDPSMTAQFMEEFERIYAQATP